MDVDRLRTIPLFEGLSRKQLERLSGLTDEIEVPEGQHVLDQGRYAVEFFVIAEGTVEVRQDRRPIAMLGPGDFFGEIGLLEDLQRTATIEATSPVRAVVMDARGFAAMIDEFPTVAGRVREAERRRLAND
jgi:CRP/FNR family cyclic AMP-dependent transcriptional regulator